MRARPGKQLPTTGSSLVEPPVIGIGGGKPLAGVGNPVAQAVEIDGCDPAVVADEAPADHHARDRGAVLGMDKLFDRIIEEAASSDDRGLA